MTAPAHNSPAALDLSREEAWVAHAAVLARIERATESGDDPREAYGVLDSLESGETAFEPAELDLLRMALTRHLRDAPARDRDPGEAALRRVDAALP